jgi:Torus domain/RNA recognition motif. (a.k.a. RRM, RBD, or RNP domain)
MAELFYVDTEPTEPVHPVVAEATAAAQETSGDTPLATDGALIKKKTKLVKKSQKKRPARAQVDAVITSELPVQTGTVYNVWYNKWSGGDRDTPLQTASETRCNIARDSGYTRADGQANSFFCLFFARGKCPKGKDCQYLHRLPTLHDIFNPNIDCFGRDKFSDYRDDMGGVGSFMRHNRTLYVGKIHVTDDVEEIVARHFGEWGQIERIRVLGNRGVAFITYTNMANSEFAKEAMAHQALEHNECLNVRWATVDPNPAAQKREAKQIEELAAEAVRRALPPEYVAELEGRDPEARKRRKVEGSFGLDGYQAPDDVWYAHEKAGFVAQQRGLEGADEEQQSALEAPEERLLIEGATDGQLGQGDKAGIFSGSTLAALRSRQNGGGVKISSAASKPAAPAGPLVDYGSSDEEDDDED